MNTTNTWIKTSQNVKHRNSLKEHFNEMFHFLEYSGQNENHIFMNLIAIN